MQNENRVETRATQHKLGFFTYLGHVLSQLLTETLFRHLSQLQPGIFFCITALQYVFVVHEKEKAVSLHLYFFILSLFYEFMFEGKKFFPLT